MSLWRAREGVRMGNALASDGARMVHLSLLPDLDLSLLVVDDLPELRSDRLVVPFLVHEDSSSRCLLPKVDGRVPSYTEPSGSSLLGRGADHPFSLLHVTFQFLATLRMFTIFRSLSCFQTASGSTHMSFLGCLEGLPPPPLVFCYSLRKSTTQILGRPMASHQLILCWMIHADPCTNHGIHPSVEPTADVTL